jgi:hypothetical protein
MGESGRGRPVRYADLGRHLTTPANGWLSSVPLADLPEAVAWPAPCRRALTRFELGGLLDLTHPLASREFRRLPAFRVRFRRAAELNP